jgi:hypothetical protein
MREVADPERIRAFMRRLGQACRGNARVYLVGGATAVLEGWRASTLDVDLKVEGEEDAVLRAVPGLKEELQLNVELASPGDFLPELPQWRERSRFLAREGGISFFHYDFYAQALAKVERGHAMDLKDVREMVSRGLVESRRVLELFRAIEPELYRYPAIDPASLRKSVEAAFGGGS